jgi:predicted amidohydrolase YtcJ
VSKATDSRPGITLGVGRHAPSRRRLLRATAGLAAGLGAALLTRGRAQAQVQRGANEADYIFRNGPIFTSIDKQPWTKAVAIRDGAIVYVGDDQGLSDVTGPTTHTIDLAGKLLMPGFVEGQIHPIIGAVLTHGVNLQYPTREATIQALTAWRDKAGKVDAVRGYGWRYSAFGPYGPNKADLDALWPDTPVVLLSSDMHAAWVNSVALKLAGIARGVPDPVPGFSFFQRDAGTGEATGYVVELPAAMQVMRAATPITTDLVKASIEEWLPKATAEGITCLFDGGIEVIADKDGVALYESLEKAKKLPLRVVACHSYFNPEEDPMPAIRQLRDRARSQIVRADVLKLILDGSETQYTAAMLDPYSDRPKAIGSLVLNAGLVRDAVQRADAEGFDVVFHAAGDRAVRVALDAIEAAMKVNGKRERRHAIAHLSLIDDEDIKRFADLGVIAQFSAQGATADSYWHSVTRSRWGDDRAAKTYRMASLLRAGATLAFGTDWPLVAHRTTFRPLDAIEVAVTRREIGSTDGVPLEPIAEAITLEQAVIANTAGPARLLRLYDKIGTIEVGKRADFVVLDRNIFDGPPHQIHEAKVEMTFMNGTVRYEKAASLSLPPASTPPATVPASMRSKP